jgi:integrase
MAGRVRRGQRAPKVVLTDRFLRALRKKQKPTDREFTYDGQLPGLAVMRTSTGHMSFGTIRHWPGKKSKSWRRLGAVYVPTEDETKKLPDPNTLEIDGTVLTLAEARQKLRRWNDLLSRGIDPAGEARKRKVEAAKRITFPVFRDAFLDHYKGKAKHGEATRILNKDFACWNHHLADEIDAQDVDAAIQVMLARGSKYQALNALAYVRTMYRWGMGQPRLNIKASPCANLSAQLLIGKKKKRTRVLTDDEIRAIWEACEKDGFIYPYGQIVRLLLLTPVRESEIGHASRSELQNDENGAPMLVVPSERMKGDDDEPPPPHEIPLTPRMVQIINSLPQWSGPYLFSHKGGKSPVNGWSAAKRRIDKLSGVTGWKFHDLRRTVRTRIAAIPAEEHVRRALTAHGRRGIEAHYDQHKYRDEKRHLLQQWDGRLQKILNRLPPDVRDLGEERAKRGVAS